MENYSLFIRKWKVQFSKLFEEKIGKELFLILFICLKMCYSESVIIEEMMQTGLDSKGEILWDY